MSFIGGLFGVEKAHEEWAEKIKAAYAEARARLEEDPNDEKAHKLIAAADHSVECAMAFWFGAKEEP